MFSCRITVCKPLADHECQDLVKIHRSYSNIRSLNYTGERTTGDGRKPIAARLTPKTTGRFLCAFGRRAIRRWDFTSQRLLLAPAIGL
jgi:hypothetical protein